MCTLHLLFYVSYLFSVVSIASLLFWTSPTSVSNALLSSLRWTNRPPPSGTSSTPSCTLEEMSSLSLHSWLILRIFLLGWRSNPIWKMSLIFDGHWYERSCTILVLFWFIVFRIHDPCRCNLMLQSFLQCVVNT